MDIYHVETAPHFEEVGCMIIYTNEWPQKVILLYLKPFKKDTHLGILPKTNRANPSVTAGLCGYTEMHLQSDTESMTVRDPRRIPC